MIVKAGMLQEVQCYSFNSKASRFETQEVTTFPFEFKGRKRPISHFKGSRQEEFCFTQERVSLFVPFGLQLIE